MRSGKGWLKFLSADLLGTAEAINLQRAARRDRISLKTLIRGWGLKPASGKHVLASKVPCGMPAMREITRGVRACLVGGCALFGERATVPEGEGGKYLLAAEGKFILY